MKEFLPRPRSLRPPLGYVDLSVYLQKGGDPSLPSSYPEEERENIFYPDPVVVPLLVQALDQLDAGISLRAAADWYNDRLAESGEPDSKRVSHAGLKKIWNRERPDHPVREYHARTPSYKEKLPREKRVSLKKKKKIAGEKIRITAAQKRIEKYEQELEEYLEKKKPKPYIEVSATEYDFDVIPSSEEEDHVFVPNPGPQTEFLASWEDEVLYGGAAGGGKSYALLADVLRYIGNPHFRGLLIRKTNDELRELVTNSLFLYKRADKGAKWSQQKSTWTFSSGATLWLTYLDDEKDMARFQGQSFTWVGFDELTHHPTPHPWNYLRTRLRSADPETAKTLCMRATTNPGGPGHGWVKAMFIDPAPPNTTFPGTDIETGSVLVYPDSHEKAGKPLVFRRFIPAKVSDNPYLWNDGIYEANLMMQPEHIRRQLLEGDWTVAEGAAFPEFKMAIHTCEPFEIPSYWMRFRSCDFGYSERQASAIHWYAVDPSTGVLYVYRELYINQLTAAELAHRILELERGEYISYGVLDSSCWAVRGQSGPTIAEEMIRAGCRWKPSDRSQGSRIASKNRLHELLRVDSVNGLPGIIFFDTCRRIISDLPVIPADKDSDDIDPKYAYDHAYDSIRYGIQTRPQARPMYSSGRSYRPANAVFGY